MVDDAMQVQIERLVSMRASLYADRPRGGVTLAAAAASAFASTHAAVLARSHAWAAYAGARCLLDARLLRS